MNTRSIAAAAAVTLLAGLGTAVTTANAEARDGATALTAEKAARYEVTATVSRTEPEEGDKITIRGSVTPGEKGALVVLQKRYGTSGKWKKADTDTLNGKGKFKFSEKVDSVRFRQYRVLKPADDQARSGKSQKLSVTVFGWRNLTSLEPVTASGTSETGSVGINGSPYEQSVVGSLANSGSIAYNVTRACKTFQGHVGLKDTSALTATGDIRILTDTTQAFGNTFGLTQSSPVTLDLTGVFRITVDWTSHNTAGTEEDQSGAIIAVGTPRILCSF
jgi:hypothetical protein